MTKQELIAENKRFKYKGFKLISLKLTEFSFFGNIEYNFIDEDDLQDKIYSTVIIGPNGTRKSLLFNLIIYIFKCIYDLSEDNKIDYKKYSKGDYHLKYSLNNEIYEIIRTYSKKEKHNTYGYSYIRNGKTYKIENFDLPITIIGNSINITDKFPFYRKNEFPKFEYLGIKFNPQSASTKSYIKKTIDFVSKLSYSYSFIKGLNLITETFIGKNVTIGISYRTTNNNKFYKGKLTIEILNKYFSEMEKRFKEREKTPPFKLNFYNSIKSKDIDLLQNAVEYCNMLVENNELIDIRKSSSKKLNFNLSKEDDIKKLKKYNKLINVLYSLNLLYEPKIELYKINNEEYSLEDSSSGEHNLITSLIGLMASIKQDSLLLIDEPEISLHPNWQMKYVSFLKDLFDSKIYNTSHIIIASHSHFIISDLEGSSSKVIGLSNEKELKIIPMNRNLNTFGWSAEDILYNIFNIRSPLNYYLKADLTELLGIISNNLKEKTKIEKILNKLKSLPKRDNDPLQDIISEADEYLKSIE